MSIVQPRTLDKITLALARLKRAAPTTFGEFEAEMANLYSERAGEVVNCPPDRVFVAQGKAQQMLELAKMISTCIPDAQKLEEKLQAAAARKPNQQA